MFKNLLFLLIFLITAAISQGAELVKNGKAAAAVVIDKNASRSAQLAALELQYHIKKISGTELPIITDPEKVRGTKIFVGESAETRKLGLKNADFKNQEYLLKVKGDTIVLMGKDEADFTKVAYNDARTIPDIFDEVGTCYAVYDFLERLGVNWYLPTDIGITFKPSSSLTIDDLEIRRSPFMKYREITNVPIPADFATRTIYGEYKDTISGRETKLFKLRQRLGGKPIRINHSLYTYYKRFWPGKPEWFAQGYKGKPPQLCYSNPEVLAQVIQDARDFFDGKKDSAYLFSNVSSGFKSDVFPVFPMDNRSWCKCPKCQAQIKAKADRGAGQFSNDAASDYIFGFVNKVAKAIKKSHPGKYIGAGTYAAFCYPPEKVKLEDNIMTVICLHNRLIYARHITENDDRILGAWQSAYPKMPKIIWMYFCFPTMTATYQQFRCFPGFFAYRIKALMEKYIKAGAYGMFIEPSYMGKPFREAILMEQLERYIVLKLADNPKLDADKLCDGFFADYYGKAAEPMRKFYKLVEKTFCNPDNYPANTKHQTPEIAWGKLGTEKRMKQLAGFMRQAHEALVGEPEIFKKRLEIFDKGVWQYMQKGRNDYKNQAAMKAPTMQQTMAPRLNNKTPGNPLGIDWNNAGHFSLRYGRRAEIVKFKLYGRIAHDGKYLYLRYEQTDIDPNKLVSKKLVWLNDDWESFFSKLRGKPYRQLAVDAAGQWAAMEHEGTVSEKWDFKGKIISRKYKKSWQVFLAIPLDDLVPGGIKPGEMLYFNVIRSANAQYLGSWIPTFGGYHTPSRFGEVYLAE